MDPIKPCKCLDAIWRKNFQSPKQGYLKDGVWLVLCSIVHGRTVSINGDKKIDKWDSKATCTDKKTSANIRKKDTADGCPPKWALYT